MNVFKTIAGISLSFLLFTNSYAAVVYVNGNAPGGNGSSWNQAYNDLQVAINNAPNNAEIWVAMGTYKGSFILKNVLLYGGFSGKESSLNQRKPFVNQTILSGDLNGDDSLTNPVDQAFRADNVAHVLVANSVTATVDGFTVQGGNAISVDDHGGGLLINNASNITLGNNLFKNNIADLGGGAVYANGSQLTVTKSEFSNNRNINPVPGNNGGGAIFVVLAPTLTINTSVFTKNFAGEDGGALRIDSTSGSISNSVFKENEADHSAGAIVINNTMGGDQGLYQFTMDNLLVQENISHSFGGAIALFNLFGNSANTVSIDKSQFIGNKTTYLNDGVFRLGGDGGAIEIADLVTKISNSSFINNTAVNDGGAIGGVNFFETLVGLPTRATLNINNTLFAGNKAEGAAQVLIDNLSLAFGIPITQVFGGGAVSTGGGMVTTIDKSIFKDNQSLNGNGGAIRNGDIMSNPAPGFYFLNDGTLNVSNSSFLNNTASMNGGAISSVSPVSVSVPQSPLNLSVIGSNFLNNKATVKGNAMYMSNSQNSLIGNNFGPDDSVYIAP